MENFAKKMITELNRQGISLANVEKNTGISTTCLYKLRGRKQEVVSIKNLNKLLQFYCSITKKNTI